MREGALPRFSFRIVRVATSSGIATMEIKPVEAVPMPVATAVATVFVAIATKATSRTAATEMSKNYRRTAAVSDAAASAASFHACL